MNCMDFVEQCATVRGCDGRKEKGLQTSMERKQERDGSCQFIAQKQFQMDKHERRFSIFLLLLNGCRT